MNRLRLASHCLWKMMTEAVMASCMSRSQMGYALGRKGTNISKIVLTKKLPMKIILHFRRVTLRFYTVLLESRIAT